MSATLTVVGLDTFAFIGLATADGRIPDVPRRLGERIVADAVDGDRWQVSRRAFPEFQARTLASATDDRAAQVLASKYESAIYLRGTLTTVRSGVTRSWRVLVLGCVPQVRATPVIGAGQPTTGRAVLATWTLQVLEIPQ